MTGRAWSIAVMVTAMMLVSCRTSASSEGASEETHEELVGVEFTFRDAEVVPWRGPFERQPGVVETVPVIQFAGTEARLWTHFYRFPFQPDRSRIADWSMTVGGCIDGGEIELVARSVGDVVPPPQIQRAFLDEAGELSRVSVTVTVISRSGLTGPDPQVMWVSLRWEPEPFAREEFDYSSASGSEYAATVPTTEQLRTLVADLYRSLTAAAADGSGCAPETEVTEDNFLAGFDRLLDAALARSAPLTADTVGRSVARPPIPVDARDGFVIVEDAGEWERTTETVRVVGDQSLAGMQGDPAAALEGRLMAITELGRKLVSDHDWSKAETRVSTPNYASVAVDGADLVITIDTKGVMSPAMRDAVISVIAEAANDIGAHSITITDQT